MKAEGERLGATCVTPAGGAREAPHLRDAACTRETPPGFASDAAQGSARCLLGARETPPSAREKPRTKRHLEAREMTNAVRRSGARETLPVGQ